MLNRIIRTGKELRMAQGMRAASLFAGWSVDAVS